MKEEPKPKYGWSDLAKPVGPSTMRKILELDLTSRQTSLVVSLANGENRKEARKAGFYRYDNFNIFKHPKVKAALKLAKYGDLVVAPRDSETFVEYIRSRIEQTAGVDEVQNRHWTRLLGETQGYLKPRQIEASEDDKKLREKTDKQLQDGMKALLRGLGVPGEEVNAFVAIKHE